jgi:hypothetical protein
VELAINPESVDPVSRREALRHLKTCRQCTEEFELAGGTALDLELIEELKPLTNLEPTHEVRQPAGLWSWFRRPIAPGWIAAVMLLLAIGLVGNLMRVGRGPDGNASVRLRELEPELDRLRGEVDLARDRIKTLDLQLAQAEARRDPWTRSWVGAGDPRDGDSQAERRIAPPRVFILGEGLQLASRTDVEAAVAYAPVEINLESPGDSLILVFERPASLLGIRSAFVTVFSIVDSRPRDQMMLGELLLPGGEGPVLLPMLSDILDEGRYVLMIQPPGADTSDLPAVTAFHILVRPDRE